MPNNNDYESNIHLRAICQLNLRNRQVGAYLLEEDKHYSLRFGLTFPGVHPFVGQEKMLSTLKAWNKGIRGFPAQEVLRIHQKSISDSQGREEELEARAERWETENPALSSLNYHQYSHTQALSSKGKRQKYQNHIFVSWGYRPGESSEQDLIENLLGKAIVSINEAVLTFKGEKKADFHSMLKEMLPLGFDESFLHWEQQLNTRMGLKTKPMQSGDLWAYAWKEFNLSEVKKIPHLIIATEVNGEVEIEEKIPEKLCPASVLIRGENALPSIPMENFDWQKAKGQYTAALVLDEKLDGYADKEHQFKYWWLPFVETHNCEIVWEAQLSNATFDNINLQRTLKFQKGMAKWAEKKGSYSVVADEEIIDSIEAQRKILQGERTVTVSVLFFLTRNSPRELNTACKQLANIFPQGKLIRETDIVPELWRNKQPFVNRRLVGSLRRHTYLSSDISLPVLTTKSFESRGMEFITFEGGKPVCLDADKHHNYLAIARTRKGKSTKTADKIFTDLSCGIPSMTLDYGMVTGETSYSKMADFLGRGGANIEVAYTNYNLFQTPNLSHLSRELQQKREAVFQASLLSSLQTITLEDERGTRFAKRVTSALDSLIVLFFRSPQNQARYEAAHRRGIGSREWNQMPTLPEFRDFVAGVDIQELAISSEAREEIVMMLSSFIRSPFGQSFSRPSNVDLNAPFLNFSLRGARNDHETTLLGTMAQAMAITRAMEYIKSSFIVEEGSLLFEKPALVYNTAEMMVNGGKSGISVSILAQDLPTVANCAAGSKFLTNTDIKMIGSIDDSDLDDLAHYLKKSPEVFERNAREDFDPDPINLCSHWLMLAEGTRLYVSHYPSPALMALVASNPQEQEARKRYFDAYEDPIEALAALALDYEKARKSGMPMSELAPPVNESRLIFS